MAKTLISRFAEVICWFEGQSFVKILHPRVKSLHLRPRTGQNRGDLKSPPFRGISLTFSTILAAILTFSDSFALTFAWEVKGMLWFMDTWDLHIFTFWNLLWTFFASKRAQSRGERFYPTLMHSTCSDTMIKCEEGCWKWDPREREKEKRSDTLRRRSTLTSMQTENCIHTSLMA